MLGSQRDFSCPSFPFIDATRRYRHRTSSARFRTDALVHLCLMNVVMPSSPSEPADTFADLYELAAKLRRQIAAAAVDPRAEHRAILELEGALQGFVRQAGGDVEARRFASRAAADAYREIAERSDQAVSRADVAALLAEVVRWDAVGRYAPDPEVWQGLGGLLDPDIPAQTAIFAGDVESAGQQYLRALAYHSAGLDQLDGEAVWHAIELIDLCLPYLSMSRRPLSAAHYVADPQTGAVPQRRLDASMLSGFHFATRTACEYLGEIGSGLGRIDGASHPDISLSPSRLLAWRHLRRLWADATPVRRHRRHALGGQVRIVRGVAECLRLISGQEAQELPAWNVCNVSRSSMAIVLPSAHADVPRLGELVGVRFDDADRCQLGIVQRLCLDARGLVCGIQLVARAASVATLEDGRAPVTVLLCDSPARGESVRLMFACANALADGALFLKVGAVVFRLRALDVPLIGEGFAMRAYQLT